MSKKLFCSNCYGYREYTVIEKKESYEIKGKIIDIEAKISLCEYCMEELFNEKLDEENIEKAYSIYRKDEKILSMEEVKRIREMYFLTKDQFTKLLNFSDNSISLYELGVIPDKCHNNVLILLKNPINMIEILDNNPRVLTEEKERQVRGKIDLLLDKNKRDKLNKVIIDPIKHKADIYSGFKNFDFEKFKSLVIFFTRSNGRVLKEKLMKFLCYTDFLWFSQNRTSITGTRYRRTSSGPMIEHKNLLLGLLESKKIVYVIEDVETNMQFISYNNGNIIDVNLTESEMAAAQEVLDNFKFYQVKLQLDFYGNNYNCMEYEGLISYEYSNELNMV